MRKGNSLIEVIIYISIFSVMMMGVFYSVYEIINIGKRNNNIEEDNVFILERYHE